MNVLAQILFYLPIGVIGLQRWLVWIAKKIISSRYRLIEGDYKATVTVVTPIYNEDPKVLRRAFASWIANGVDGIIAVVDDSDESSISTVRQLCRQYPNLISPFVTSRPGKRPALTDGIRLAKGEIVILVDSDTIWDENVLSAMLAPFADSKVGGVATRQSVWGPGTMAQILFDIRLSGRYDDDLKPQSVLGQAVTCLSGRTAVYRRSALTEEVLAELETESFLGFPLISGDDKCLTRSILRRDWRTVYQEVNVSTIGFPGMQTYLKQYLRWSRNSWRSDIKALFTERWVWRFPWLSFCMVDHFASTFTSLLAPIYLVLAAWQGHWLVVMVMLAWWAVSRPTRIVSHLWRHPEDIAIVPVHTLMLVWYSILRLYALVSVVETDWSTRWDETRVEKQDWASRALSKAITTITVAIMVIGVSLTSGLETQSINPFSPLFPFFAWAGLLLPWFLILVVVPALPNLWEGRLKGVRTE